MHIGRATQRAIRFVKAHKTPMAVVHCGGGEYTVKAEAMARKHYPNAIRRIVTAAGDVIESATFSATA